VSHARLAQEVERQDARLRRVAAAHGQRLAREIGDRLDAAVLAHDHLGVEVAVAVAHPERQRPAVGAAAHAHVRERRVPGDVHVAGEERLDLTLVVREEREVHRDALEPEVLADALPDGDDLGVVGDGGDEDGVVHG
jgi:hypothetical protein